MSKDESPPLVYVRSALRVTMSDLRTSRASLLFRFCLQRHILSRFDDMQWRDLLESEREYLGTASMRACRLDELFLDDMGALQTFIEKFHPLFNAALLGVVTWAMLFWKRLIVSMSLAYLLGVTGLGKRAYRAAKKVKSTNRQLVASCVGVNVLYAMLVLPGVALLDDSCLYVEVAELICGGLLTCFALKRLTEKLRRTLAPAVQSTCLHLRPSSQQHWNRSASTMVALPANTATARWVIRHTCRGTRRFGNMLSLVFPFSDLWLQPAQHGAPVSPRHQSQNTLPLVWNVRALGKLVSTDNMFLSCVPHALSATSEGKKGRGQHENVYCVITCSLSSYCAACQVCAAETRLQSCGFSVLLFNLILCEGPHP